MTKYLEDLGYHINPKRVRRLLRMMGIIAIYPQKNLSASHPAHKKYPYLLKDLTVDQANMVWCTDLTYIRLNQGFIYLSVIMDWYSRYVLSWGLSNSMDASFCIGTLRVINLSEVYVIKLYEVCISWFTLFSAALYSRCREAF